MSTKHTTTQSESQNNVYDSRSMAAYHLNMGAVMPQMRQMMANPFNNPFYNQTLRQGMSQANRAGATSMQNMLQGLQQRGIANGSPAAAYLTALQGRNNSALQANAFNNAQNQAANMYGFAANTLMNFHPLQTGANANSTMTQKTSGLGTWLPQVAGIALGGLTGGLSTMAGGVAAGMKGALGGMSGAMGGGNPFAAGGGDAPAMGNMITNLEPNYNQSSYNQAYGNPFGGPGVGYNTSPYLGVPGY